MNGPGLRMFTRIFQSAHSMAMARVRFLSPAFDAP